MSDGQISNIAMLIVDNGHTFVENGDESTSKVLEFIQANSLIQQNKHTHETKVDVQQLSQSLKARLVVFTANFLIDSQTNGQLVEVNREFEKLKTNFHGNKVHQIIFIIIFVDLGDHYNKRHIMFYM